MPFRTLCRAAVLALTLCVVVPHAADAQAPPRSRWQTTLEAGGTRGGIVDAGFSRGRVVVAGAVGGDPRGDFTNAAVWALRRRDGDVLWSQIYDSGRTDSVAAMVAAPRIIYVAGGSSTYEGGTFRSQSFVHALRARDGTVRWQRRSEGNPDGFGEVLYDATLSGEILLVAGSIDRKILVRALDARRGRLLWEDTGPPEFTDSERATRVFAAGGRVYVAGDRDTVLGRSAPYVVRAYDLATGTRLWESQFGQQINTAVGLQMADDTLVLGGHYYNIGPGVRVMEIWGLDPDTGAPRWSRRPAGSSFSGSNTSALLSTDGTAVIGGTVYRARTLPVVRAYRAVGTSLWNAAADDPQSASVGALASHGGTIVAAGSATTEKAGLRHCWLRGTDTATGATLWQELLELGAGDSSGVALATDPDHLAVGANALSADEEQLWVVRVYRLP